VREDLEAETTECEGGERSYSALRVLLLTGQDDLGERRHYRLLRRFLGVVQKQPHLRVGRRLSLLSVLVEPPEEAER